MAPGLKRSILGMGNPLLDIIADVDQAFLDKYEAREGDTRGERTIGVCMRFSVVAGEGLRLPALAPPSPASMQGLRDGGLEAACTAPRPPGLTRIEGAN